jgi:hypothetical protein
MARFKNPLTGDIESTRVKYLWCPIFNPKNNFPMKTRFIILLSFLAGLFLYNSCNEKLSNPSPEEISEGQSNVNIKLRALPDGAVGKTGVAFVFQDHDIYSNKQFTVEEDGEVSLHLPEGKEFDIMLSILKDENEWDPENRYTTDGWFTQISNQMITPQQSQLNLYTKSWGNRNYTIGAIERIVECEITNPYEGQTFTAGSVIEVNTNASDNGAEQISSVELHLDGNVLKTMENPPYYYDVNTKDLETGKHKLFVKATNGSGDMGTDEVTFYVTPEGSSAPYVEFRYLSNNYQIDRGDLREVQLYINDDGQISEAKLFLDGSQIHEFDGSNYYTYRWKTENYQAGTHELKATVTDDEDNQRSDLINVELRENSRPIVSFEAPDYGEKISRGSIYEVRVSISDPDGIYGVGLEIDNSYKSLTSSGANTFTYDWDTSGEYLGTHTLEVYAQDNEYNYRSRTIEVTIQ